MGCYYRVVAFEFLGCDRAFCLFVLSPHYDQTAIGYKFIQDNIILEIFLQDISIIFGNLYVNIKIHGHVLKTEIRVNFGRVPATLEIIKRPCI